MQIDLESWIYRWLYTRRKDKIASPFSRARDRVKEKKNSLLLSPSPWRKESTWPVIKRFCTVLLRAVNATKICWVGVTRWPGGRELIRAKVRGGDDDVELARLFYSCYCSMIDRCCELVYRIVLRRGIHFGGWILRVKKEEVSLLIVCLFSLISRSISSRNISNIGCLLYV